MAMESRGDRWATEMTSAAAASAASGAPLAAAREQPRRPPEEKPLGTSRRQNPAGGRASSEGSQTIPTQQIDHLAALEPSNLRLKKPNDRQIFLSRMRTIQSEATKSFITFYDSNRLDPIGSSGDVAEIGRGGPGYARPAAGTRESGATISGGVRPRGLSFGCGKGGEAKKQELPLPLPLPLRPPNQIIILLFKRKDPTAENPSLDPVAKINLYIYITLFDSTLKAVRGEVDASNVVRRDLGAS
ncbi:hypothetical protein B296_00028341 [Ensete ventricosum]|uniref:Uncharacterized protein n=1 Tax=Ensete ventricosum TaxID=4639 RepID=A0A427A8D3_ENSVE|nr:hypothetical protein B296_00028341 [Ensete ventricosum]